MLAPLQLGSLRLATPLLLAPIAGFCDLAFRLVVRSVRATPETGIGDIPAVGLACTDLLCPHAILRASDKTLWLAATSEADRPLAMQLYGRHVEVLRDAALWAQDHGASLIDINMGCPVDKVTKKNGGSKLLCEPQLAEEIVREVAGAVRVPVTCKIRLGWSDSQLIVDDLPPRLADAGAVAITVHGRTTEQLFRGQVQLAGIARVVASVGRHHPEVKVIGNGDVLSPADALRMLSVTGCHGVMIGRGALRQPWLFRDVAHMLATGSAPEPLPRRQRAQLVLDHFEQLLHWREERIALNTMRQRMSWYSAALQPWPGLRQQARLLESVTAFREFMAQGMAQMEADAAPVLTSP